jgi:S1-C subfamily serine protease
MSGPIELTIRRARALAVVATVALTGSALVAPAFARGPENIADVAEKVIDAVVNISTTQKEAPPTVPPVATRRRSCRRIRRSRSSSTSSSRTAGRATTARAAAATAARAG